jgi:uncharacterized damage-inducible protein DinB
MIGDFFIFTNEKITRLHQTMKKTQQIASRFREVILNGTWIANTNYKEQLTNLDWKIATTKFHSFNTIAILSQHIHYYISGILKVLNGGTLDIKDQFSFDFPAIESQQDWENFLSKFWKDSEEFAHLIEQMPDEKLEAIFVEAKYGTYQRNIDAMIEHSYYHLGQIVLIKKGITNND